MSCNCECFRKDWNKIFTMPCARKLLKFKGYNNNRTLYQCVRGPKQKPNYQKYVLVCENEISKENLFAYCPSVTPIVKMIVSILSMFKNCLLDNFFPNAISSIILFNCFLAGLWIMRVRMSLMNWTLLINLKGKNCFQKTYSWAHENIIIVQRPVIL